MALARGDSGDKVKDLQRCLNKLGSLLVVDGGFGSSTEIAVTDACGVLGLPSSPEVDDTLLSALQNLPEPSKELTAPGVTFVGREEISGPDQYRSRFRFPVCPPPPSGITIGIGYDLKFVNLQKLQSDWSKVLSPNSIERLAAVTGKTGSQTLLGQVNDIEVPLLSAVKVFLERMMPDHITKTRAIYPCVDDLPSHRRAALISLVFNRGASLEGDSRREMKQIQELLATNDLEPVADQFEAMTRLWDPKTASGLIARRRREALLWRSGFEPLQLA
jgi:hypothetical protein